MKEKKNEVHTSSSENTQVVNHWTTLLGSSTVSLLYSNTLFSNATGNCIEV